MLSRTHVTDWLTGTSRTGRLIIAVALSCSFMAIAGAVQASASTVTANSTTHVLTFTASPGETNVVTMSKTSNDIQIQDTGSTITATGCTSGSGTSTVVCPSGTFATINVDLGDQDDQLT